MPVTQAQATINGKPLVFETGKYAKQAGGAVTVRYGDTIVFAAATVAKTTRPGIDFFPLTVDFEERLYAAGKIPGSFPRREGRPSEEGILTARLTDRPIRPLFPKGFRGADALGRSVRGTDRLRSRRHGGRRAHAQPDDPADAREQARPRRRGHARLDHDDGGR